MNFDVDRVPVYAYTGARTLDTARDTVVFVHGAGHDHSVWAMPARYFAHHGKNALALDLPAHGRSGGDALERIEDIADWLVRAFDALALDRVSLVGHSMGALAALECASRASSRVAKLALVAPSVPMPVSDALLVAAEANDPLAFELIVGWSFAPERRLGGNRMPGVWMAGSATRLLERSRPGVLHRDLRACNDYTNGIGAATRVAAATLIVLGERDLMAPVRNTRDLAHTLSARVDTVARCGHMIMIEAPDALLDSLRAFL